MRSAYCCLLIALFCTCRFVPSQAATINYGDKSATPLVFLNVEESSTTDTVALFGSPAASVGVLDFDPTSFVANSTGTTSDTVTGKLTFTLMDEPDAQVFGFRQIGISEFGDYTLQGAGTALTNVLGTTTVAVTVKEINGTAVTPFLVNGSNNASYNLPADSGFLKAWTLDVAVDLVPELINRGYGSSAVVTKAEVEVVNTLHAASESGSAASLAKKDHVISATAVPAVIPEPTCLAMSLAVSGVLALCGRRSR